MHPQFTNPDPPVIGDVRFRKALMHAMDRQAMADTLQFGLVGVAQPWLSPEDPRFEAVKPSLVSYEYDPARAVQMIEGLGYTRAAEGLFQDQAGRPLSVEARSIPSDLYQSAMLAVANYWQKSGVGVTTVPIPAQRTTDIAYRATRPGFEVLQQPTDPQNLSLFRIANVPRPENNYRGPTGPNYMDKDYDDLVGKYFATIPAAERTQVLAQILHQVSDQLILMPLFYTTEPSAVSTRIRGVPVKKPLNVTTWNAAQWDIA
jgi:peptide/nickel transport system substrate-binding protein